MTQDNPKTQENDYNMVGISFLLSLISLLIYLLNVNGDGKFQTIELISFMCILSFGLISLLYLMGGEDDTK